MPFYERYSVSCIHEMNRQYPFGRIQYVLISMRDFHWVLPLPRAGGVVNICNVEGWGIEPSDSPLRNGGLTWWIDGLEYHIISRIPLNQILRIANSMC